MTTRPFAAREIYLPDFKHAVVSANTCKVKTSFDLFLLVSSCRKSSVRIHSVPQNKPR